MARQVLPIVGAVVGGIIGGPTGAQIGFALGSIVGGAIDPQVIQGPRLGESGLQTSAEGVYRPIVFGTVGVKGNVIARGNRQVKTERTRQGKGGPVTEQQRVYWTFAIRISEGPIAGVSRIWMDEKLVYDVTPGSGIPSESADFMEGFRLYLGDEAQLPDPDLEAFQGVGNTNSYRGTAYIVFPNMDLTDRRESIPDFRFEVSSSAVTVQPGRVFISDINESMDGLIYASDDDGDNFDVAIDTGLGAPVTRFHSAGGALYVFSGVSAGRVSLNGGNTWSDVLGIQASGSQVNDVAYGNGSWYFVYQAGSFISKSEDGISLSGIDLGTAATRYTVAVSGSTVLIGGSNLTIDRSTMSGALGTWTSHTLPLDGGSNVDVSSIIRASGGFVAGRSGAGRFAFSIDGDNDWTMVDPNFPTLTGSPGRVALGVINGIAIASKVTESARSSSGASWLAGGNHINASTQPKVATDEDRFYVGSTNGSGPTVASTNNGIAWTNSTESGKAVLVQAVGEIPIPTVDGQPVPLSEIVESLHLRIGHDANDYDTSELTDEVDGLVLAEGYTAADAIRTLMPIYFFDGSEFDSGTGYRLHYPKRGKPVVLTITEDDIIQAQEKTTREDPLERPRMLHLHYQNPTVGYAPAKATARRDSPDVLVVGEASVQVPVCFEDVDEPARISNKLLKLAWVEVGGPEEFSVHDGFLGLVPSDCIGLVLRGQQRRLRIVEEELNPGEMIWKLLPDRQSAYDSAATGIPVPEPTPPLPSIVGPTIHELLDIPALNDSNDRLLWYEAATGQTEAWYGAQTQRKIPPATEFEDSSRFTLNTIMGVLVDPVPAASEHFTDHTNTVRVQLYTDDAIDSLTTEQFLSEGGSFALENADGTWEILQYRDSDDEGSRTFALTYLARGRLNTGGSEHLAGARFVLLDGVNAVDATTAWINANVTMRAVSFGTSPESATQETTQWTAKSQTEFPVANIIGSVDSGTLSLRFVPRHRFGTEDNPVQSSNWIGYRWVATDGVNSAGGDTPFSSFTVDVTGWSPPITVTVSQLNRFTGAGPSSSEIIP